MQTVLSSRERIAEIVDSVESIATLPEVTAKITQTVNDPRSTAADLHRVIAHDPALVARILRVSNSSFYARAREIDSLERAIVMLGFDTVHAIAIAATIGQLFRGKICEGYSASDLWTHCIAVAATSRAMAQQACEDSVEEAFLAGLLHDVGLLVELQACRGRLRTVCEKARLGVRPFTMLELELIGVDHQGLGEALAAKWGFPPLCQAVAAHHHRPSLCDERWRMIAAMVHVADTLCCHQGIGFNLTALAQMPDAEEVAGLVPLPAIEAVRHRLVEIVEPAIQVFS